MKTINDIFIMCYKYWLIDTTCIHSVFEHCHKGGICLMQWYAVHNLLKDGEYH